MRRYGRAIRVDDEAFEPASDWFRRKRWKRWEAGDAWRSTPDFQDYRRIRSDMQNINGARRRAFDKKQLARFQRRMQVQAYVRQNLPWFRRVFFDKLLQNVAFKRFKRQRTQ